MKKSNQEKKSTSKGVKLPLIQSNAQKVNLKENRDNNSKGKLFTKGNNQKNSLTDIPQIPNISLNIPLTKSLPKNTNLNQNSSKTKGKSEIKRNNNITKEEKSRQDSSDRYTEDRLTLLKKQRNLRLKQKKKEEMKEMKIYEKLIEGYKNNTKTKSQKNKNETTEENPKVIISSKKARDILEEGGMLDAYKYVLAQLCKNGLPSTNVFEYASYVVKNYEKEWKEKKSQRIKDTIDKYYEEKQKEINKTLENDGENKTVNKSLEYREELKFIQSLDKSRAGRNIVPKINNNTSPKNDRFKNYAKDYIAFFNKKFNYQSESKVVKKENEQKNENIKSIKLEESNAENNIKIIKSNSNENSSKDNQNNNNQINKNTKNKNIK